MKVETKNLTIKKAHESLIKGEYSAVDLASAYLENIKKKDKDIHAYLEVFDDVLEQAKEADKRIKSKKNVTLMTGIPIAVKDNILIKGRIASSASKILENYVATYDATVIRKLKEAGAVFLGRTNMDEFAMGGSTENSAFGVTKNPHDLNRVSGGTSGGSAATVAADMALVALGSDTGGSIRQPASFCGVIGLKPSYGAVSRYGLMAAASSFDQIGTIGKTSDDVQTVFDFIKGSDSMDSTSCHRGETLNREKPARMTRSDGGLSSVPIKIGIPKGFVSGEGIDKEVLKNFNESVEKFKELGYEVKEIDFSYLKYSLATYYTLIFAEESSNLARFDGVRYGLHTDGVNMIDDYFKTRQAGFGVEVKRRIILGTYILSSGYYDAYYNKANIVRDLIREDYRKAFVKVDVIITPTTPGPAFKIGEKINDPLQLYLEDIFTVPANLAGLPAMSIPCGFKEVEGKKLPLGLQIFASQGGEETIFEVAKAFEGKKAKNV